MTFKEVLQRFRTGSFTEREKGAKFEKLMKRWFQTDPRYADKLQEVWLWEEFPGKKDFGGKDLGIDLVAKTDLGDYWAIQCKCYDEKAVISKAVVDSFISTAHRAFIDDLTLKTTYFSNLIWVSTTLRWGANAEETLKGQDISVTRINMHELEASPVDWDKLLKGDTGKAALREGKQPRKHQLEAMKAAHEYFRVHDRDNDITIFLLIRSPLVERTHHTPHALHDIHLAITGGDKKNSVQSRHIHPFGQATHVR